MRDNKNMVFFTVLTKILDTGSPKFAQIISIVVAKNLNVNFFATDFF